MATSSSGSGQAHRELSNEQIQRIEQNRRKALEKLSSRRAGPIPPPVTQDVKTADSRPMKRPASNGPAGSAQMGPPPRKFPAYSSSCSSSASSFQIPQRGGLARAHGWNPPSSGAPGAAAAATSSQRPSGQHQSRNVSTTAGVGSALSVPIATAQLNFAEIRRKIKANFTLISKSRFKVVVQYDTMLIEIFKKVPSRAYDAKTATWSFGIEDFHCLVEVVQRDCKHVQLNLIPKPVTKLFLSRFKRDGVLASGKESRGTASASTGASSFGPSSSKGWDCCDDGGGVDWGRINSKLTSTLMQFQKEGVEYSIQREGRVLIADDMGLGKTLQAIAVMCYYRSDWPLLVVCPSSVRLTWAEAFKRWVPSMPLSEVNVVLTSKTALERAQVTITSYDLLVKMAKELQDRKFKAVIIDESHFLKNYKTARCKAAQPIIKGARRALLLSGTPALSRPIELYTQITALDRTFKISLVEFGVRYCNGTKNHFGWDLSGASNMQELQLYMEEQMMIRRMKTEVLDQLPTKQRQMVLLDPSVTKAKAKEWKEMRQGLDKAGSLKALERKSALLPLFNMTGLLKIPAIIGYVLDLLEGGRKLIVFGHHRAVLDAICECLQSKKYRYIRIDGQTPAELRQSYCDQFQHDEQCLVAVLSITTANAGLTLTAASTVVFAELFWNPGILMQAEDRAYRIGQKASVNVHYLVARDTADDFIWPLIQSKLTVLSQAGLARDDFSDANSKVLKDVSQKDLLEFFGDGDTATSVKLDGFSHLEGALCSSTDTPPPPLTTTTTTQPQHTVPTFHNPSSYIGSFSKNTASSAANNFPDIDIDFEERTSSSRAAELRLPGNVQSKKGGHGVDSGASVIKSENSTSEGSEQLHGRKIDTRLSSLDETNAVTVSHRRHHTDLAITDASNSKAPHVKSEQALGNSAASSLANYLLRSVCEHDMKDVTLRKDGSGGTSEHYDDDSALEYCDLDSFVNFED